MTGKPKSSTKKNRRQMPALEIALDKRIDAGAARLLDCNERVRAAHDAQLTKLIEQRDALMARMDAPEDDSPDEQVQFPDDLSESQWFRQPAVNDGPMTALW